VRDIEKFPTKFGPATTRMPPLPNLRGKRKSTWKLNEPEGRVAPETKSGKGKPSNQSMRGPKGIRKQRSLRTRARAKAARKRAHKSRQLNRRNA